MTAHVVYTPVTVYRTENGGRILSPGREEVKGGCPTLARAYEDHGCMTWSVQGHEVRFCPYCGAEIIQMGKVITGERPFSDITLEE